MKKPKKHHFKYLDPKTTIIDRETKNKEEKNGAEEVPPHAIADLKRSGLTILVFIALIILLYFFRNQLQLNELIKFLNF